MLNGLKASLFGRLSTIFQCRTTTENICEAIPRRPETLSETRKKVLSKRPICAPLCAGDEFQMMLEAFYIPTSATGSAMLSVQTMRRQLVGRCQGSCHR